MDVESLAKQLILQNMTPEQQNAVLESVRSSLLEARNNQKRRVSENVGMVVEALKKIEADIRAKYDDLGGKIETRVNSIRDGRDGIDGRDGKDGKDGRPGRDGAAGAMGPAGRDGVNGLDGEDGVSVTDAKIDFDGSLVITLSNGREINVGEVVAPDLAERIKVITNGGGTSQAVLDTLASLQTQINNLIPSQTGNAGKFLTTNGSALSWSSVAGGLSYQGTWNASTNTPTLTSSVGVNGYYYIVATAGSTNLNGITDWQIGDWLMFNGSVWQKIDQSNLVTSVNGQTGAVSLTTTNINEGTNQYYLDSRARSAISAGTGISYSSSTGVITNSAPDQTVALTGAGTTSISGTYPNFTITSNDQYVGTVTSVGGTGTVNGISLSGTVTSSGSLTLGGTLSGVDLATQVTGTLPIANGGTGQTSQTAAFDALSPTTTKGDLIVSNGSDNVRLPVGANNYVLVADSAEATGVKWSAGGSGMSDPGANGIVVRTALNTTTARAITAGTGISVTDGNGVSGNPTITNSGVTSIAGTTNEVEVSASTGSVTVGLPSTINVNLNGTVGATTANTGAFTTLSATGVTTVQAGTAAAPSITTSGDTNTGIFFPAADTIAFAEGGVEVARFDSAGNFGIGTSSPTQRLDVSGNIISSQSITVGTGGLYQAGSIYSDANWGMLFRAKQASPGIADFRWANASDTERMRIDTSGNFQFNSGYGSVATAYGCRAWVNFNGTGTVAIRASGNVTSITDNGTGDYTVNFTTAMPDANYSVNVTNAGDNIYGSYGVYVFQQAAPTSSGFRISTRSNAGTYVDPVQVNCAIFR